MEADKVECLFYGNEGKPVVHPTDPIAKMVAWLVEVLSHY